MSIQRFFIPKENIQTDKVVLPDEVQKQIRRVLRLQDGDHVIVLDGQGIEYEIQLTADADGNFEGQILSSQKNTAEPHVELSLYIPLTQREKFEWILQKGTETGVAAFHPFICQRSLVQKADGFDKKHVRWEKILREAAEQCGRGRVPVMHTPVNLKTALNNVARNHTLALAAWVQEKQTSLKETLKGFSGKGSIGLFIGPEGGFDKTEIGLMDQVGLHTFSLGPRILRMETAAILLPALVLYQLGEMQPPDLNEPGMV